MAHLQGRVATHRDLQLAKLIINVIEERGFRPGSLSTQTKCLEKSNGGALPSTLDKSLSFPKVHFTGSGHQ